jgi:hypothetical protein
MQIHGQLEHTPTSFATASKTGSGPEVSSRDEAGLVPGGAHLCPVRARLEPRQDVVDPRTVVARGVDIERRDDFPPSADITTAVVRSFLGKAVAVGVGPDQQRSLQRLRFDLQGREESLAAGLRLFQIDNNRSHAPRVNDTPVPGPILYQTPAQPQPETYEAVVPVQLLANEAVVQDPPDNAIPGSLDCGPPPYMIPEENLSIQFSAVNAS